MLPSRVPQGNYQHDYKRCRMLEARRLLCSVSKGKVRGGATLVVRFVVGVIKLS